MKRIISLIIILVSVFTQANFAQKKSNEQKFDGYLFAYFEGSGDPMRQEQLRYGISTDGFNWSALNYNQPIVTSSEISQTGGIRDPYLVRKSDNSGYYLVATDMFTHKNGWGPNPGIVLMKSNDLLEWESSIIDLPKLYPEKFGDVNWVWAPQVIYDVTAKKYLVYFTIRFKDNGKLDFYCAYANKDFTGFEDTPELMFSPKYGGIDADIIFKDGLYHLFFKANTKDENGYEFENGIQQATAKSLKGPWKEDFIYLDAYADTSIVVEGSSIFKLNNADEYILMYDLYANGRYEFQRSKDLFNFTEKPEPFSKDFHPRHGSVISITKEEAGRLNQKWSGVPASLLPPGVKRKTFQFKSEGNPVIKHFYTADPAGFVENDTLWLYTGHDFEGGQKGYRMKDWLLFSTTDMKNWTAYPVPLKISDFKWATSGDAYAAHVEKRNGKYYWYISTNSTGIGVAVSDRPEGPFKDALGKPLLTNDDCFDSHHWWACIDPAIFVNDDEEETPYIFWGNGQCYYAKLKDNMTEIDGDIHRVNFEGFEFTEAPWIHKHKDKYYLTYATGFPEKIAYAMADHIEGPWEYKGILNEIAGNSNTNHQSIVQLKDQWYFIYHNGGISPDGGSYSRSVCIDKLEYNVDGTIKRIVMTTEGVEMGD
jgi:arabinoxylan arabinofuranohydrolase